jgi:hypothetical protein
MKLRLALCTLFFALLVWPSRQAKAQLANCEQREAAAIKNAKVYFLLKNEKDEQDKYYNTFLQKYVTQFWNISKYEFAAVDTIDRLILNPKAYFVTVFDEEIISNNGIINVSSIGIIKGGKAFKSYRHTDELAWVYIRKNMWEYAPRFASLIQVLQNTIAWKADPANKRRDIYESFNKQVWLKNKTLYIERTDLNEKLLDVSKLHKHYKYEFEIVDRDQLLKAIESQDPNVIYMHPTNNRNSSCFFISAKDGKVIWEHQATINTEIQLVSFFTLEELSNAIFYSTQEGR